MVGRERARVLKAAIAKEGIPAYRITGNYIEKTQGTHNEYWGAEIVLHVATVESVVDVKKNTPPPIALNPIDQIKDFLCGGVLYIAYLQVVFIHKIEQGVFYGFLLCYDHGQVVAQVIRKGE